MPEDVIDGENELRSLTQEQYRLQEQITMIQQHIHDDDTWLTTHLPTSEEYQDMLEEWLGLQAYAAELRSQALALEDTIRELRESAALPIQ